MVLTRAERRTALLHVVTDVFMLDDPDNPLSLALSKAFLVDIYDILAMPFHDIDRLDYLDDQGNEVPLPTGYQYMLRIIKHYDLFCTAEGDPIGDDWKTVTADQYDEYRLSADYAGVASVSSHSLPSGSTTSPSTPRVRDAVFEFKKGIKRDSGSFLVYKDEKQWDTWQRSTLAQARAQDVHEILDASYVPVSGDDKQLFAMKQEFMYAVFERTLQTDMGKAFVRRHEADFDAQTIYKSLLEYSLQSTKAFLDTSKILAYITSARLGDGSWTGKLETFILQWQDKLRQYDKLVKDTERFPASIKRVMLENAVHPIAELRAVKNQADQLKTTSGTALTYEEYCRLVLSAAASYDNELLPRGQKVGAMPPTRRSVYFQELDVHDDVGAAYDIDTDIDVIQAHLSNQQHAPGSRMPFPRWKSLSPDTQSIWDTIPDSDKALILGAGAPSPLRRVRLHDIVGNVLETANASDPFEVTPVAPAEDPGDTPSPDTLVQAHNSQTTKRSWTKPLGSDLPPSDIRKVLSSVERHAPVGTPEPQDITIHGKTYRLVNVARSYQISAAVHRSTHASLVDRGANGGVAGEDVRVIFKTLRSVDIQGLDNHQVSNIPIATVGGVVKSQRGDVIAIMHQYAYIGRGRTIHSSAQLEWYQNDVNDCSVKVPGGLQRITTLDGYVHPLNIVSGLPYVTLRPYTDAEWETLPHVIWTGDIDWDPGVLDHTLDDDDNWFDAISDLEAHPFSSLFDEFGDYRKRMIVQDVDITDRDSETLSFFDAVDSLDACVDTAVYVACCSTFSAHLGDLTPSPRLVSSKVPDYERLRPFFGWMPTDVIKRTFEVTTQYACMPMSTILKKRYKSPNPALNVHRRDEPVATDTVFSDTPAIDGGETAAQIFVGTRSYVTDVEGMKSVNQFVNTLEDNIRRRGAPTKLISDRAQVEISNKVKDVLRALCISDWQSEPLQQHQNPCERRYQTLKSIANTILDRTGSPAYLWLLCLMYVCFLLNNVSSASLHGKTPIQVLTRSTNDISPLLFFRWYEPVYYKVDDSDFPSDSHEKRGRWVGIAEHVGHAMTFKILTDDTRKIIYRSNIRSALDPDSQNLRMEPLNDDLVLTPIIKSRRDSDAIASPDHGEENAANGFASPMPIVDPNDLVGRTFLMPPQDDGQRFRARIVRAIQDHEQNLAKDEDRIHFLCSINDDQFEEIMSYNELLRSLEKDGEDDTVWRFR